MFWEGQTNDQCFVFLSFQILWRGRAVLFFYFCFSFSLPVAYFQYSHLGTSFLFILCFCKENWLVPED